MSFNIAENRMLYLLIFDFLALTTSPMSLAHLLRMSLYRDRSSGRSSTVILWKLGSGTSRSSAPRRRQRVRGRASRRVGFGVSRPSGSRVCRRKTEGSAKGSTWRNFRSDRRSSNRFWIGVPVRHHRRTELRPLAAWNCFEDWFRIQ